MTLCFAILLAASLSPLAQAPTGSPELSSVPEYNSFHRARGQYPDEETALLEIHVAAPVVDEVAAVSGEEQVDPLAGLVLVQVYCLDDGLPYLYPMLGWGRDLIPVNSSIRVRAPLGRQLGIVAYCRERGYDEVVLAPMSPSDRAEEEIARAITLQLPSRSEGGTVFFSNGKDGGNHPGSTPVKLSLLLPKTRMPVASVGWRAPVSLEANVPSGNYLFCARPTEPVFCSEDFFRPPDLAGFEEIVRVRAGERMDLTRSLERGVQLEARLVAPDADDAMEQAFARDMRYLSGEWWEASGKLGEPERWFVTVKAARFDEQTERFGLPMTIRWRQVDEDSLMEWTIAPLGDWIHSSMILGAGRYRVSIEGPLVETAIHELVVKLGRQGPQKVEWELRAR